MTVRCGYKQNERLIEAIHNLERLERVDANSINDALVIFASLRAYRAVFEQLKNAESMHLELESLRENVDQIVQELPAFSDARQLVTNDIPADLMLSTVWSILQFVLRQLLCNAVAAALKVPGQVTVSATIEEDSQARYCRISITNPGTLSPAMRDSILQRQPVLRQDGQYGTGLLAAGELLGVLRGHLQYPKTAPGVVQAAALLTLGGDQT